MGAHDDAGRARFDLRDPAIEAIHEAIKSDRFFDLPPKL